MGYTIEHLSKPAKRCSMLGPFKAHICGLLETHKTPPITNLRIFEIFEEKGCWGKITILRNYLAQVRGKMDKEPVVCT